MGAFSLPRLSDLDLAARKQIGDLVETALQVWESGDNERDFDVLMSKAQARNDRLGGLAKVDLWRAQYEPDYLKSLRNPTVR